MSIHFIKKIKSKLKVPFINIYQKLDMTMMNLCAVEKKIDAIAGQNAHSKFLLKADYSWMSGCDKRICHAMGVIDSHIYTNTYDAFLSNYNGGYRFFECDISLTSDYIPVVSHGWAQYNDGDFICDIKKADFSKPPNIPSYETYKSKKLLGKYMTLSLYDVVMLASEYKDVRIIISIETIEYDSFARQILASLAKMIETTDVHLYERLIPQVHGMKFAYAVINEFEFKSIMYGFRYGNDNGSLTYLKALAERLDETGIRLCSVPIDILSKDICDLFHDKGIKVISFTSKNQKEDEKAISCGADFRIGDYGLW